MQSDLGTALSDTENCPPTRGVSEDRVELMIERSVASALEGHEAKMIAHMDKQHDQMKTFISSGFPGGDPHGHRLAHETQIRQSDGWQKLKAEVTSKFITGGLWAAAGWAAYSMWHSFVSNIKH